MLLSWIAAYEQDGRSGRDVAETCCLVLVSGKRAGECCVIRASFVVNVVGLQNGPRKFLQQIVLFVRRLIGANDADSRAALAVANLLELARSQT